MIGLSGQNVTQAVAKEPEPGQGHALFWMVVKAIQLNLISVLTIHLAAANV